LNIITKGNGHGVGMSQWGANYMAEKGKKYDEYGCANTKN